MPSGSPLRNIASALYGGGITAKSSSAASAMPITTRIATARRAGDSSLMTLMPVNFERQ